MRPGAGTRRGRGVGDEGANQAICRFADIFAARRAAKVAAQLPMVLNILFRLSLVDFFNRKFWQGPRVFLWGIQLAEPLRHMVGDDESAFGSPIGQAAEGLHPRSEVGAGFSRALQSIRSIGLSATVPHFPTREADGVETARTPKLRCRTCCGEARDRANHKLRDETRHTGSFEGAAANPASASLPPYVSVGAYDTAE